MTEEEKKKLQNEEAAKAGTQKYGETADIQSNSDYDNTMAALDEVQQTPQMATTQYDQQISDIYDKIVNRKPFEYDINSDPVYQNLKQEYMNNGRKAMEDTIGQAAALTGGYSNTYAQSVGQQQYDAYMRGLNEQIPDLYNAALDRYTAEGNAMLKDYDLMTDMRDRAASQQSSNRENLLYLIATGYKPTEQEIADAGMTQDQVNSIMSAYGSSGGGGYDYSGLNGAPAGWSDADIRAFQAENGLTVDGIWGPKTEAAYYGSNPGGVQNNPTGGGTNRSVGNNSRNILNPLGAAYSDPLGALGGANGNASTIPLVLSADAVERGYKSGLYTDEQVAQWAKARGLL